MKKIVKFEIQDLLPIGMTLVVAGIGLVYGLNVVGDVRDEMCLGSREHLYTSTCFVCPNSTYSHFTTDSAAGTVCSNGSSLTTEGVWNVSATQGGGYEWNASQDAVSGIAKFPEKMPLIATVVVAAIIIGILVRYLMVSFT